MKVAACLLLLALAGCGTPGTYRYVTTVQMCPPSISSSRSTSIWSPAIAF
jgi:hypothetical protein